MKYLLDTCLLSELTKPAPAPSVVAWLKRQTESSCYISVLTLGELMRGIHRLPTTAKRTKLEEWMQTELLLRFKGRIITINEAISMRWGILVAKMGAQGRVLPSIDSLLAATAQEHGLTIVTRNTKDFQDIGIEIFNPW